MKNPIIVALDVEGLEDARQLVGRIGDAVEFYKVGLELFTAAGPDVVRELTEQGKQVFVDLKMYDIGETVKRAVASVARLGATFLTVHSAPQVVRAAMEGAQGSGLKILAVTVLTSFDRTDLQGIGIDKPVREHTEFLAKQGTANGVDGFITSPLEVAMLREVVGPDRILVTPGVRSAGASKGDQKRVATPVEAMRDGADYLVIGREITRAEDPRIAAQRILEDLRAAG